MINDCLNYITNITSIIQQKMTQINKKTMEYTENESNENVLRPFTVIALASDKSAANFMA